LSNQIPTEEPPKFCRLDLRTLVERCHEQMRRQQPQEPANHAATGRESANQNGTPANVDSRQKSTPSGQTQGNRANNSGINSAKPLAKSTYTIACIDDSPTVLNAINSFLDDKSFSVVMINDPVRALMQVVRIKPDLILLDVEMPNLDGYELCSLLRKHSLFKTTPIIMVTGNTGFLDRAKAKLVRASGYLTKPFNQSELLKMVFKHLS
jgi:two-component system, chemotaxis family, response regulator PixG